MSESVAARVSDETKQWLESEAEDRDSTVSDVVAGILEEQSGDVPDMPPVEERLERLEYSVGKLIDHSKVLERELRATDQACRNVSPPENGYDFPALPGEELEKKIMDQITN